MSLKDGKRKKHGVAVLGSWQPVPLDFLRSRACAELSPHATKLLLDALATLGPNAAGNGDISFAPSLMIIRGWTSRATLSGAVKELVAHDLLVKTKQGDRLDCCLFAVTLYPLNCDLHKLDVKPGCYFARDFGGVHGELAGKPTEVQPAKWRRVRKLKVDAPSRNKVVKNRSATKQTQEQKHSKTDTSFHHGTKPPVFEDSAVPSRVTFLELPSEGNFLSGYEQLAEAFQQPGAFERVMRASRKESEPEFLQSQIVEIGAQICQIRARSDADSAELSKAEVRIKAI